MFKTIRDMLIGALVAGGVTAAVASVGIAPTTNGNQGMVDQTWLNGVAAGLNATYQYGISAAGSAQSGATQLASGYTLMEVDTVSSSTGVALPPALAGTEISVYNNGANSLTVYPSIVNNGATGAQDTINNTTLVSVSSHTSEYFFAAKNGIWAAK